MIRASEKTNLPAYDAAASYYASLDYLTPCERLLFNSFIRPGSAVLDLGVGGGRTTRYLASRASAYVGVDYSAAMVKACREKFPQLEFRIADAADLSEFRDESFDAVVFAFNGIDYVFPSDGRRCCFQHIHRVLKRNGCVIFSSHNPRAILVRPHWNRERVRKIARRFSSGSVLLYELLVATLTCGCFGLALAQCALATLARTLRRVPSRAFWNGEGNFVDPSHGGLFTHYSVPDRVMEEMNAVGFRIERVLGDDYPLPAHPYATDWYYYVFTKR
ncbi:MAG TPA: class I SAM-dependent methyltransferase [Candidatus Sulfotelmatobacter sp.]